VAVAGPTPTLGLVMARGREARTGRASPRRRAKVKATAFAPWLVSKQAFRRGSDAARAGRGVVFAGEAFYC